jgi:hypothetical protein
MVYYFAFDLDETLGSLHTPYYFLRELLPERYRLTEREERGIHTPSEGLREILHEVYTKFVKLVASRELSTAPLGILRPGILNVLRTMVNLKKVGLFGGAIIYSNNDSPPVLDFANDIIEAALGEPVFCDVIYRTHPIRNGIDFNVERTIYDAKKTWEALKLILETGSCGATNVRPEEVFFFDDLKHPDLLAKLPPGHYIQVSPYSFRTTFDTLADIYLQAIRTSAFAKTTTYHDEFANYISSLSHVKSNDEWIMNSHIRTYKDLTKPTSAPDKIPPPPDTSAINMRDLMRSLAPRNAQGGRRTRRGRIGRKTHRYNRRR